MATYVSDEAQGAGKEAGMLWLWYLRGDSFVFGVWSSNEAADGGGARWCAALPGWIPPTTPPRVELVFPWPECGPAIGVLLDRDHDPGLRAALHQLFIRSVGRLLP